MQSESPATAVHERFLLFVEYLDAKREMSEALKTLVGGLKRRF